jgi:hypothetical protein
VGSTWTRGGILVCLPQSRIAWDASPELQMPSGFGERTSPILLPHPKCFLGRGAAVSQYEANGRPMSPLTFEVQGPWSIK